MEKKFDMNQYFQIKRRIEECDAFYTSLYSLTDIEYNDSIDTACVTFDEEGNVLKMKINYDFWSSLNEEAKTFVIMHELSHVMYEHGKRVKQYELDPYISNIASDIFINHHLHEKLGINRDLFDWKKYCWVETCFPEEQNVPTDKNFEFYYQKLNSDKNLKDKDHPDLLGNHQPESENDDNNLDNKDQNESVQQDEPSDSDNSDDANNDISDILKKIIQQNPELIDDLKQSDISQSIFNKNFEQLEKIFEIPERKKITQAREVYQEIPQYTEETDFKRLMKILVPKKKQSSESLQETWVGQHRRYSAFLKQNNHIFLPNIIEIDKTNRTKKEVWIFMDTSGSCTGMFPFFSKIIKELLKSKEVNCRAFSFDDDCFEIFEKDKTIRASFGNNEGGFDCIEEMILKIKSQEKIRYPDNVVVLSDGAVSFNLINQLEKPENWIMLLDCDYYMRNVPKKGKFFLLDHNFFNKVKKEKKSPKMK